MKTITVNLRFLILAIFLISSNLSFGVIHKVPSNPTGPEVVEAALTKTQQREKAKLERKTKKFQKKMTKIQQFKEQSKKGLKLVIVGGILLLVGIILVASIPAAGSLAGVFSALLKLIFGITLGVGGFITMIIGFIQGV